MSARSSSSPTDRPQLLLDTACAAHLGMTPEETSLFDTALRDPATDAATALRADLRRRLDDIERQEANASARREHHCGEEVWSYALSDVTRACRLLLDDLDQQAKAASRLRDAA